MTDKYSVTYYLKDIILDLNYMKDINQIIEKDIKWLLHFLKENHIQNQYFQKIRDKKIIRNFNTWRKFIFLHKNLYLNMIKYSNQVSNNNQLTKYMFYDFLKGNSILFSSSVLFSVWAEEPFTLVHGQNITYCDLEHKAWKNIRDSFVNTKSIINNFE